MWGYPRIFSNFASLQPDPKRSQAIPGNLKERCAHPAMGGNDRLPAPRLLEVQGQIRPELERYPAVAPIESLFQA